MNLSWKVNVKKTDKYLKSKSFMCVKSWNKIKSMKWFFRTAAIRLNEFHLRINNNNNKFYCVSYFSSNASFKRLNIFDCICKLKWIVDLIVFSNKMGERAIKKQIICLWILIKVVEIVLNNRWLSKKLFLFFFSSSRH